MNFKNFRLLSQIFKSNYGLKAFRGFAQRRPAPELPSSRPSSNKNISGLGKILFLIPVTTFSLGTWQVKRKIWKENLIKEMEEKLNMDPESLPDNLEDLNNMEYRNVTLRGHFIHNKEVYLGPRGLIPPNNQKEKGGGVFSSQSSTGYQVITPFKIEGREETILVNRGWIPRNKMNPQTRKNGQVEGTIQIQGIVRLDEPRPQFTPEHTSPLYLYRDLGKMCSMTNADPFFIDIKFDSKLPQDAPIGSQTRVTLRNEHMQYIITWYSLSAITAFYWWRQIIKKVPL